MAESWCRDRAARPRQHPDTSDTDAAEYPRSSARSTGGARAEGLRRSVLARRPGTVGANSFAGLTRRAPGRVRFNAAARRAGPFAREIVMLRGRGADVDLDTAINTRNARTSRRGRASPAIRFSQHGDRWSHAFAPILSPGRVSQDRTTSRWRPRSAATNADRAGNTRGATRCAGLETSACASRRRSTRLQALKYIADRRIT